MTHSSRVALPALGNRKFCVGATEVILNDIAKVVVPNQIAAHTVCVYDNVITRKHLPHQ